MEINHKDAKSEKSSAKKKTGKPPEKRLFHRPVRPWKIAVYVGLAVLLAALVYAGRFVYVTVLHPSSAFDDTVAAVHTPTQSAADASVSAGETATATLSIEDQLAAQAELSFMKDRVNILLTGIDYSEEREGRTDFRTDTILLMCIDFASGEVDMLSVPRDSYADIAWTTNRWKINGAYMSAGGADGDGFACLMETVSMTLGGIPINYYVGVEMQAVKDIVDIIGGVWYDVDYEIDMNGRHLDTGYQLLDGQSVLDYCRARKGITSGTDIDRIDRQQRLLIEVFKQMQENAQISMIPDMYQTVSDEIYTNLSFEQIAALALFMLDLDPETELNRYALQGEYMTAYDAYYYVLDHTVTVEILKEIFGDDVDLDIDWHYSIDYVRADSAMESLRDAAEALQLYIDEDGDLTRLRTKYPDWTELNDLLDRAYALLDSATDMLSWDVEDITEEADGINELTEQLEDMLQTLTDFVTDEPEPTPTPTVEPTPTSTGKTLAGTPSP